MIAIDDIQAALSDTDCDGWLLYDFHGLNPIAQQVIGVRGIVTRRWFLYIPRQGRPVGIVHRMEEPSFDGYPATWRTYGSWKELDAALQTVLSGVRRVAMEYSPDNAIPYVARVDAGTVEKIRATGTEVVSSADLVARLLACWTSAQIDLHRRAAAELIAIKDAAFALIAQRVTDRKRITEFDIVLFIREAFDRRGMETSDGPICAVGPNAGIPHYEPTESRAEEIGAEQLVLLDLWAKCRQPDAVYADITWVGYTARTIPAEITTVFDVVARARDRALAFINETIDSRGHVMGWEVDRAVRGVIAEAGYGEFFVHRTGHSLGTEVHGIGPHIDDLETQDRRRLRSGMAFSIEPGIYLPDFGIRLEIDCLMENDRAVATTLPLQTEVTPLV